MEEVLKNNKVQNSQESGKSNNHFFNREMKNNSVLFFVAMIILNVCIYVSISAFYMRYWQEIKMFIYIMLLISAGIFGLGFIQLNNSSKKILKDSKQNYLFSLKIIKYYLIIYFIFFLFFITLVGTMNTSNLDLFKENLKNNLELFYIISVFGVLAIDYYYVRLMKKIDEKIKYGILNFLINYSYLIIYAHIIFFLITSNNNFYFLIIYLIAFITITTIKLIFNLSKYFKTKKINKNDIVLNILKIIHYFIGAFFLWQTFYLPKDLVILGVIFLILTVCALAFVIVTAFKNKNKESKLYYLISNILFFLVFWVFLFCNTSTSFDLEVPYSSIFWIEMPIYKGILLTFIALMLSLNIGKEVYSDLNSLKKTDNYSYDI